jgi:peptidoglycan hydrolase-like protein with peptidoglycan-binding domain
MIMTSMISILCRKILLIELPGAALTAFMAFGTPACAAATVGPSFLCSPPPQDALARVTCADSALARADIRMVQTYYALRQTVGKLGQKPLKSEFLSFVIATRQKCGLPPVEPGQDQTTITVPPTAAQCVVAAYDGQRERWLGKLAGAAAEEANRAPELNIALQAKLQALGYLPANVRADGVFGTGTRNALIAWQRSKAALATGFFGDSDAATLLGAASQEATSDPNKDLRAKPLAGPVTFDGKPVDLTNDKLRIDVQKDTMRDPDICKQTHSGFFELKRSVNAPGPGCPDIKATILIGGTTDSAEAGLIVGDSNDIGTYAVSARIVRLDPSADQPQVFLTSYSGGAHCCTAGLLVARNRGAWQFISLGELDGDEPWEFLDLNHNGTAQIVGVGQGFDYEFSSYAGSFAPTLVQELHGSELKDVSSDLRYHWFILRELKAMERNFVQGGRTEPNGYYAGWVAQKALLGEFEDGWKTMLANYDQDETTKRCGVDERVWPKNAYGSRTCPDDEEIEVPFPEALALDLVKKGYISQQQSITLGFDPSKIAADRAAALELKTRTYEQTSANPWFVLTRFNECKPSDIPKSPAEMVSFDKRNGLEDLVDVIESSTDGKPIIVRVSEPKPGDMVSTITFYRGQSKCEEEQQMARKQLDQLR